MSESQFYFQTLNISFKCKNISKTDVKTDYHKYIKYKIDLYKDKSVYRVLFYSYLFVGMLCVCVYIETFTVNRHSNYSFKE